MSNNIRESEARLKEAFGEEKFNQYKKEKNRIMKEHREKQAKMRQEMFQSMNRITEKHFKNF